MLDSWTTAIGDIAQGAIGGVQFGYGLYLDSQLGDQPKMEIPQSSQQALNIAKVEAARKGMPGQKAMEMKLESQIAQAANRMLDVAGGSAAGLGAMADLSQRHGDALTALGIKGAEYEAQAKRNLQSELTNMANWEMQQWMMNTYAPYMQEKAAAEALVNAGMNNMVIAGQGIQNTAQTQAMWDQYFAQEPKPTTQTQPTTTVNVNQGTPSARDMELWKMEAYYRSLQQQQQEQQQMQPGMMNYSDWLQLQQGKKSF